MCLTLHQVLNTQNQVSRPSESDIKLVAPSPPEACRQGTPQAAEADSRVTQLQLPEQRGQTRRNPDGRDSRRGAHPLLFRLKGHLLAGICRRQALPLPRAVIKESHTAFLIHGDSHSCSDNHQLPRGGQAQAALRLPYSPVRRPPGAGRKVCGSPGDRREAHTSGQKSQREGQASAPHIKMFSACTVIPGRGKAVYCLLHGDVTSCSRTSGLLT